MILRLIRWWAVLLAGGLLGAGVVLHGQLAMGRLIREEVESVPGIYRAIGHATFFLQDATTRSSLLLHEIPEEALEEGDHMAWTLVICGALCALAAPMLLRRHGPVTPPASQGLGNAAAGNKAVAKEKRPKRSSGGAAKGAGKSS